ncbi:cytochrome c-type biogenesis protein CcmH [Alphaproteobacteria bacterium]|jgi:cytochrome c-type biogenesis protein CcmH|nr:cytochrome c-type biogenesis protein CcmH [Alphaproteobacteria bacterium]MDC3273220.1 cytochrome c-type biogenesis protein CcmH [Alphaproteobacteria bacterium]|tara:strand:- start:830 stop:1234 length:405 start_codon:yes stop_codon:yes gene_type:complete
MLKKINLFIFVFSLFLITAQNNINIKENNVSSNYVINKTREIGQNIRCLVCQNQSIDESSSQIAQDLRILIKEKIETGSTDKEIYEYLSDRYGDYILLNPPLKTNTILLWFLPFIILILGLFLVMKILKKSRFK